MCDKTVRRGPFPLQYVLNWFVTQQQVKIWHDNSDDHDKNRLIEWYDSYKSVLKLHVEKELMPIAWHPSRCGIGVSLRTRKMTQKNCGHRYGLFCVW